MNVSMVKCIKIHMNTVTKHIQFMESMSDLTKEATSFLFETYKIKSFKYYYWGEIDVAIWVWQCYEIV